MAQYLLSVWHPEEVSFDFETDEARRLVAQVNDFNNALMEAEAWVTAGGLSPIAEATVFDADGSRRVGLYDPSDAMMGGFWLIEAATPEEAQQWATRAARACEGSVELRPLMG